MGILRRMATWYSNAFHPGHLNPQSPQYWVAKMLGRTGGSTGIYIDQQRALAISSVWCAVNLIAGAVGYLPMHVYRRLNEGKNRATEHPAYPLLHLRANPYMDAMTFRETLQGHVLFHGNGYAEIERNGAGQPIALWPLLPNMVTCKVEDGAPVYEIRLPKGPSAMLPPSRVLHVRGLGFDGLKGYSVIDYAAENLALTAAIEEFGAKFFKNGVYPSGVLETDGSLNQKQYDALKASFDKNSAGLSNAHRTLILQMGLKWHQIGADPKAAQLLVSRKYNVEDVARWFNVPAYMLQSDSTQARATIEQKADDFIRWTLLPWLRRWEMEVNYKLFAETDIQAGYLAEFRLEEMLRADANTQAQVDAIYLQNGIYSINEVRNRLNMNPVEGGDEHLQPLNLTPVDGSATPGGMKKPTSPAKTKVDDEDNDND